MITIQRFPRPYRFPRREKRAPIFTEPEDHGILRVTIVEYKERAGAYGIPWDEYREEADGRPGRFRIGFGAIPLRFPRSRK
jgi:hypothetical protein